MNQFEESVFKKYNKTIWTKFRRGIRDYKLISDGDKVAVCISGGKDSMIMAVCLKRLCMNREIPFSAKYIVMNPGYNAETLDKIRENAEKLELPVKYFSTRIFESAEKESKHPCFLCSRLRRGWLYKTAQELDCNKIALGHHFDDVIETTLMSMLYGSQMQTMLPRLKSENYEGVQLIRPLYLVRESDIISWAQDNGLEFTRCACSVTAKPDSHGSKRGEIKELICRLRETNPAVDMNIFRSAHNVDLRRIMSYHIDDEYHSFLDDFE